MDSFKVVTDASWEADVLQAKLPVLVDFWAPWCGPCKALMPTLTELAAEYQGEVIVAKVNVDENPATRDAFGIRGIPAMLIFTGGEERERLVGGMTKTRIAALLDSYL